MNKQVLSILVENTAGVLSRVSGLFSRRGYSIDSISAGVTKNPSYTRMTVVCNGDALILENGQAGSVSLVDPKGREYLSLSFDAPLVGLWSPPKKQAPFVCIEPWYGRCDREGFAGELKDREWENSLEPGKVFEAAYRIRIA